MNGIGQALGVEDNYQATTPNITKQNFNPAITASQTGLGYNISNEQALNGQLAAVAGGQGPNPVQAQYQNNVNQNTQQMAGAIASQKGINPALAARLIASQTANANQNAAGTAAVNQGNLQLGAMGAQAGVLNNIGTQQNQNQATLQGAQAAQNNAINTGELGAQGINAGVAETNTKANAAIVGGLISGGAAAGAASLGAPAAAASGGVVPGHAKVSGNSPTNDTQKFLLSPGEAVIPRSVMQASDAPEKAKKFVEMLKAQGKGGTTASRNGYGAVLQNQKMLHQRLQAIEQHLKGGR